jgi:LuxR family maltose regulon positive regulatory protein
MTSDAPRFRSALPLVEAKLRPPAQRPATVERDRLLGPLLDGRGPRVVAVIAPPGYGKTTLLAQWAAREPRPVAWLTLDDLDNDPAVLLSYVATAFDRIGKVDDAICAAIAAPHGRILAVAVPRLLVELARWDRPAALVLDDAHRLVDRTVLDVVASLLDHLPPGFRVAIAARTEPELPFARLRAAGDLLEIGTGQLALTDEEAAAVVAADHHPLRPEDVRTVRAMTEGWAAGIHLAALALGRGEDGAAGLDTLSGRDRYIAAYLRSEFQRSLEPEDVVVLTRTAILETVTPPMAEAVAGVEGAWARLAAVARRNLLVQDVGAADPALRYHNLLRDFLLGELDEREPGARPELHRRAAAAYARAHELERAVEHAFASGDLDAAAAHVAAALLPTFFGGHPMTVDRWILRLDDASFLRHPQLAVLAAWIHLLNGRADAADRMADIAERSTLGGPTGDGAASFESQRAMLQAMMTRRGPVDAMAKARVAAEAEGQGSPWQGTALGVLGGAHRMLGQPREAEVAFAAGAAAGNMVSAAFAAALAFERGDWEAASGMSARARAMMGAARFDELLQSIVVYAIDARVAIHRGDPARAREDLVKAQRVRPLASQAAPWLVVDALLHLARAYLALGDPSGAHVVLREAEAIVRRRPGLGVLTTELLALRRQVADARGTLVGFSTLTTAELRLLPLLPTYLSFQEIADRLGVSRNTVKTQAMSIYGKLQASSRGEAVERAVELGLLEPYPGLEPVRRQAALIPEG